MTRKPPPHRRKRDPLRKAQLAPRVIQPGPSPLAAEMTNVPEWSVRHVGIGVLAYDTEDEARVAAGTAGTLLHWGQEVD